MIRVGRTSTASDSLSFFATAPVAVESTLSQLQQRGARMADLADGETFLMQGSGSKPYELKNTGGVYSCSCPAWRNQSLAIEKRTCKHLKKLRGEAAEIARVGSSAPPPT